MKAFIKKFIALFLIIGFLLPMTGNLTVRADSQSGEEKYYYVNIAVLGQEPERCLVKDSNQTFMVDMVRLCEKLDLDLVINNSFWETSIFKAKQSKNYYISQTKQGIEKTFTDCKDKKNFTVKKKNTDIMWYFSEGSEKVYASSPYMGNINLEMGTAIECEIINGYEYVWVPLVPFLSIFDSAHQSGDNTLMLLPCAETVFDVLHSSKTGKFFYAVDEESGNGEVITQIKLFYNTFYKKVKSFFKNAVSFHWIKALKNMTLDHSPYAESLALELCRYNEDEISEINKDCELIAENACLFSDTIKEISELASSGMDQKAQEAARLVAEFEKRLNAVPDEYVAFKDYNDAMLKAAKTAQDSKSFESVYEGISKVSPVVSVALAGAVEYITLSDEINSAQESRADAVLTYLDYLDKQPEVNLYSEVVDDIRKKAWMYHENSTNFYYNTAMSDRIIEAISYEAGAQVMDIYSGEMISYLARYKFLDKLAGELTSATFLELKASSFFWEIGEIIANKLSGGAFDELESFQLGFYTEMLEGDTSSVMASFKNSMRFGDQDNMLETYRQLEWVRLKSNYLARQNVMGSYKHYADNSEELFHTAFAEEIADCETLVHLMGILACGNEGTTQKKLNECRKNFKSANEELLFFAKSEEEREADNAAKEKAYQKYLLNNYSSFRSQNAYYAITDMDADGKLELIIRTNENDYVYRKYRYNSKNRKVEYDKTSDSGDSVKQLELTNILFLKYPPGTPLNEIPLVDYIGMTFGELKEIAGKKYLVTDEGIEGARAAYYEILPLLFGRNELEQKYIFDPPRTSQKIDWVLLYDKTEETIIVNNSFSSEDTFSTIVKKTGLNTWYNYEEEDYWISYQDEFDHSIDFEWFDKPKDSDCPDRIWVG